MPPPPPSSRLRRYSSEETGLLAQALADLQAALADSDLDAPARATLAKKAGTARMLATAGAFADVHAVIAALERAMGSPVAASPGEVGDLRRALAASLASLRKGPGDAPARPTIEAALLLVSPDVTLAEEVAVALAGSAFDVVVAPDERAARVALPDAQIALFHAAEPDVTALLVQRLRARTKLPPFAWVVDDATMHARAAAARASASLFLARPLGAMGVLAAARQLMALREVDASRVLVLDTDEERAEALRTALDARGLATTHILDVDDLEEALLRLDPDALVVGAPLPIVSVAEVCRMVRSSPGWQTLPLFVCLPRDDTRGRALAFEAGADDVDDRWQPAEMAVRIRARTRHARMLREHASYDGLTGLLARGTFLDAAGAHLVEARRAWRSLAIGMVRVHDDANDPHGQMVVTRAASLLYGRFPPPHLLARWSARELVVLATGDPARTLAVEMEEVRARLETDFLWQRTPVLALSTVSMPQHGITLPCLLREALARL